MEIYKKPNSNGLNSKRDLLAYLTEKIPKSNDQLWFHQSFGTISLRFFWYHSPLFWLYPYSKVIIVTTGFTFIHNIKRKREFTSSGSSLVGQETSLLKAPANPLLISVYQVSHSIFLNQFLDQEMPWLLGLDWASLVALLVKNLSAMRETWVRSLGWEDPLEKGKATHSSSLASRIPWTV